MSGDVASGLGAGGFFAWGFASACWGLPLRGKAGWRGAHLLLITAAATLLACVLPLSACATNHTNTRSETRREVLKKCSACKMVMYCGKDHQKADWEAHKDGEGASGIANARQGSAAAPKSHCVTMTAWPLKKCQAVNFVARPWETLATTSLYCTPSLSAKSVRFSGGSGFMRPFTQTKTCCAASPCARPPSLVATATAGATTMTRCPLVLSVRCVARTTSRRT